MALSPNLLHASIWDRMLRKTRSAPWGAGSLYANIELYSITTDTRGLSQVVPPHMGDTWVAGSDTWAWKCGKMRREEGCMLVARPILTLWN